MPGIEKLPIEETLEDSPQTRSLLRVFEEDTAAVSSYCTQLYQAMQRIYDAQNELSAATHLTSRLLKEYDKQRFPLGGDDEVMSSTLQQFAKVIDERSSLSKKSSKYPAMIMTWPLTDTVGCPRRETTTRYKRSPHKCVLARLSGESNSQEEMRSSVLCDFCSDSVASSENNVTVVCADPQNQEERGLK
ncbi:hypothetical protein fugu_004550 [Takifugu bimaculatus]|uniref:BAR domain-containing protein n=1 Tax=Takifugu bimaculatus TaxID=433685 RepID=A0A4Z2B9X8_9TELE|nr:hypothetical protein fugu_004550 [Takifugu bimaculatus]